MQEKQEASGLSFGQAIASLEYGLLVRREGWNGKDMFLFLRPNAIVPVRMVKTLPKAVQNYYAALGLEEVEFTSYICMKAADHSIVNGWLASQTDMLATDWEIVDWLFPDVKIDPL